MAESNFERVWNDWHLGILNTVDLACYVLDQVIDLDCPDWLKAAASISRDRLRDQTENAPVPPWHQITE